MADEQGDIDMKTKERDLGNWRALESNPDAFNEFMNKLGVLETSDGSSQKKYRFGFEDYFGLELLPAMPLQGECVGAVYLFQDGFGSLKELNKSLPFDTDEKASFPKYMDEKKLNNSLFYTKQVDGIGDACGAIACIHALSNINNCSNFSVNLKEKGPLANFLNASKNLSWDERGEELLKAKDIQEQSEATAESESNQTQVRESGQSQGHFIAFIRDKNSNLIELDGRKAGPINHGKIEFITDDKDDKNLSFFTKVESVTQQRFVIPISTRFEQYKLDSAKERFEKFEKKMINLFEKEIKQLSGNAIETLEKGSNDSNDAKMRAYEEAENGIRKGLDDLKKKIRYSPPQAPGAVLLPLTVQEA